MEKIEKPGTVKGLVLDKFNNEDRLSFANRHVFSVDYSINVDSTFRHQQMITSESNYLLETDRSVI